MFKRACYWGVPLGLQFYEGKYSCQRRVAERVLDLLLQFFCYMVHGSISSYSETSCCYDFKDKYLDLITMIFNCARQQTNA